MFCVLCGGPKIAAGARSESIVVSRGLCNFALPADFIRIMPEVARQQNFSGFTYFKISTECPGVRPGANLIIAFPSWNTSDSSAVMSLSERHVAFVGTHDSGGARELVLAFGGYEYARKTVCAIPAQP
jgi:hypothetical protein